MPTTYVITEKSEKLPLDTNYPLLSRAYELKYFNLWKDLVNTNEMFNLIDCRFYRRVQFQILGP